jgi:tetratricopeptide (TPR) repeat protein
VNNSAKLLLLVLLVKSVVGFGQQQPASSLKSLVAVAQQAQAAHDYAAAANAYAQAVKVQPTMPELWANLGLMQHEAGEIAPAIQSFRQAIRLNPALFVPNLFLGIDDIRVGKAAEAVPFLLKAERSNAADSQVPLALGRAYLSLNKYPLAIHELNRAVTLNPKFGSAWFALGIAYLDQVEVEARNWTNAGTDSPYIQALFAESLQKQFRFPEASEILRKVVKNEVQPPCVRSELGYSLLREHTPAAAAAEFIAERAARPECSLSILGEARIAIDTGEDETAMQLLEKLWLRDPGFMHSNAVVLSEGLVADRAVSLNSLLIERRTVLPAGLFNELSAILGVTTREQDSNTETDTSLAVKIAPTDHRAAEEYYAAGQFQLCAARLRKSTAKLSSDQLQLLATCEFFTGDYARSADAAASLALQQPHSMPAYYWSIKAKNKLAFEALDRFQQLEPNSAKGHILMGDVYRQRLRFDDAEAEYTQALTITPNNPAALMGLASAFLDNSKNDDAMKTAHEALARTPDDPDLNLIMAEALIDDHRFVEAKPFLDKCMNAKPHVLPHLHALLGRVYAETGKTQEAIAELKMGELSDVDGSVHYQLARLYRQAGDDKNAAVAFEQMKAIRLRRHEQKLISVEDPDFTASEAGP